MIIILKLHLYLLGNSRCAETESFHKQSSPPPISLLEIEPRALEVLCTYPLPLRYIPSPANRKLFDLLEQNCSELSQGWVTPNKQNICMHMGGGDGLGEGQCGQSTL